MADLSMNVNYAKPQTTSLGEMVNLAGGIQNFQQAQQLNPLALEKAQIENQVLRQKNDERLKLQEFTSNPDNWQTNGRIDMDKLNSVIPKLAPLTGSDVINSFSQLHTSQTNATKAKNAMTQDMRQIVGGRLGILGRMGIDDPQTVIGELDRLTKENPDSRELKDLIEAYKVPLSRASRGPNVVKDLIAQEQYLRSLAWRVLRLPLPLAWRVACKTHHCSLALLAVKDRQLAICRCLTPLEAPHNLMRPSQQKPQTKRQDRVTAPV